MSSSIFCHYFQISLYVNGSCDPQRGMSEPPQKYPALGWAVRNRRPSRTAGGAWGEGQPLRPNLSSTTLCHKNGWCFISWNSKEIANKIPQSWSPPAEKLDKSSYFQHIAETKQPYTMTRPSTKATSPKRQGASQGTPSETPRGKRRPAPPQG